MSYAGQAMPSAVRTDSPAANVLNRLTSRGHEAGEILKLVEEIHLRLYGPRPEPTTGEGGKPNAIQGLFPSLQEADERIASLHEQAIQRAKQCLEALAL